MAGPLVVDQETLCEALGVSRTTLWRAITFLEERNALLRVNVGGSVSAYALDPTEIWKSWDREKEKAVFRTKTLVRKSGANAGVKRRMQLMLSEGQPELPQITKFPRPPQGRRPGIDVRPSEVAGAAAGSRPIRTSQWPPRR